MLASVMIYSQLKGLVNGRVFPAPRPESADQAVPYVTYQKIGTVEAINTLDEYIGAEQIRVQINVYHGEQLEAETLAHRVKVLLSQQRDCACEYVSATSDFDPDTQLYAEINDFYIWQSQC